MRPTSPLRERIARKVSLATRAYLERAVYKAQSATDRVAQLGAEIELPDLGMMECANEPVGIIGKGIARFFVKLSSARDEAVEFFDFRTKDPEKPRFFRDRVHPLYHKFRDQMDIAGLAVIFPHEGLNPMQDVPLGKIEPGCDPPLELKGQAVHRPAGQILHFGADPQRKS